MLSSPRGAVRTLSNAPAPQTVSPAAQAELRKRPAPPCSTIEARRQMCDRVQHDLGSRQLQRYAVTMEESELAGVPVRVFAPPVTPAENRQRILLNLHGGGFTQDAGSITENVPIAALTEIQVVAARYRMAPESPFPAAVDDAEAVYRALLGQYSPDRIGLYGTSAGAILCSQLLVRLQQTRTPLPGVFGFFSGTADLSRPGDTEHFFRPPEEESGDFFSSYIGDHNRASPQLSPLFADLSGFPPTLCVAGTRDFLLSQTALFHRTLLRAGVPAELVVYEAMPHAHWIYLELPESDEAFGRMAAFLKQHL